MNNRQILDIAMAQSAIDLCCRASDFEADENIVVYSGKSPLARKYLDLPFVCNLVYYGRNIVASVDPHYERTVRDYIGKYKPEHCFETPNMNALGEAFAEYGKKICFMAEYFLPDVKSLVPLHTDYKTKVLYQSDFARLYDGTWSNALCEKRKELDVLGVGAYDGGKLIGLAACSADCETMWQIGVDVLPEYRRRGVASALTSALALEILGSGKVPFYCCAWSNIASARNAIKSGLRPAWVELTVKDAAFANKMNE